MKHLILIFATMLIALSAFGQSRCRDCDVVIGYSETYSLKDFSAADTIGVGDSVWTYTILKESKNKLFGDVYFEADSVGGTAGDVYVIFKDKAFDEVDFSPFDTVTWAGTADTSFVYSWTTSRQTNLFQVEVKGSSDGFKAEIEKLYFKFLED